MILGLTGSIGTGKSSALAAFAEQGWRTLDADALVGEVYRSDSDLRDRIVSRWGERAYGHDGLPCRPVIAECIFGDASERAWLEEQIHPRVLQLAQQRMISSPAGTRWCFEVPLLFEKSLEKHFDATVAVVADVASQTRRLLAKGLGEEEISRRIASQLPTAVKIQRAGFVLLNEGSLEFLRRQVARLSSRLQ